MIQYLFFDCYLEGRQLRIGESGFLVASEVVHAICDADFRKIGFDMTTCEIDALCKHKYVKEPKEGMYLMEITDPHGNTPLVFFDTRTKPNFVWVQTMGKDDNYSLKVAGGIEKTLNLAADKYGWKVKLKRSKFDKLIYVDEFKSAMEYVDEYQNRIPEFASFVTYEEKTDKILSKLHLMIDKKTKPIAIMRVIRAAIDAGLIVKPDFECFIKEFKINGKISLATFKYYTTKNSNPLAEDKVYLDYLDKFLRIKDNWLDAQS